MNEKQVVALAMGIALVAAGVLLSASETVAIWGLSHGRARIWVKMLGPERALKLTRYFFGPLVVLMGLFALTLTFFEN